MREDFQGDSLGQWASYPPVQDVGYEPSLTPTAQYDAPGGRALMRVVKPNVSDALHFGFIKKIRIVVSDVAKFSFAYRVNTPKSDAQIEIGLAGTDGTLFTKRLTVQTNRWTVSEARLSEFRDARGAGPSAGIYVEAVYLVAMLREADPDTTYRFMIDDLQLKADREANLSITIPATKAIDPWAMVLSSRGYRAGDKIAFEVTGPVSLERVNCILRSSAGSIASTQKLYDDGTHGDRRSGDNIWSNNSVYSLTANDHAGLWNANLDGLTADRQQVSTEVRLIVHSNTPNTHPHLFFSGEDRSKLIARSRAPKLASLWANIQTTAKSTRGTGKLADGGKIFELLDSKYLLPSLLAYFDVLNRARSRISHNAFEAYITGSEEARDAAKAAMLDVAKWKRWQPPWFNAHGQHTYYPAGLLAADVALGYDLLYSDLTESERVEIRKALIEKSIIPTYREYVVDNRVMANTSNWIAHTVGGALIAAASIAGDVQEAETDGQFEIYLNGLLLKLEDHLEASFLPDGSYGEGISYHEFDSETLGPALNAVRRNFGIDYWKQTHVLDSLYYPLYTLARPTSESLDLGDTHAPAGHGIAPMVYESKDPVIRWYFDQFDRPLLSKFIFYDDSVAPQPPKLPTSRIFRDKGNAVFRTSWDEDAIIWLYRAGPNFNHHHADQGSFLLNAFGENLVTEAGWSDYYKDPYYVTYFTQAIGHNTILVGGNPESQSIADTLQFKALNKYPRITDSITSEFYDAVGSDLSSVYQDRLARYTRRTVFVKPYYFVVFDDLKANGRPTQFDLLIHLPNRERITTRDLTATYTGEKASLALRQFTPGGAKLSVENGHIPYHILSARTPDAVPAQPAYLDFKLVNAMSEAQFVTAIVPAKSLAKAQSLINQISAIEGANLKGVLVHRDNETDLMLFRVGAEAQTIRHGEWQVDGPTLMITETTNNLKIFAVQNARSLRRGDRILFSSEAPLSVAANSKENEIQVVCNADKATRFSLFIGKSPLRVQLDGNDLTATAFTFNSAEETISLDVARGQHDVRIIFH